uniref:ADP-ribose glycohydrolase ARH3-like n=1 Tax=Styela clava TaxID=7725 RepID=UPI001939C560|nr:ADP-ribose glycohydrolase ARH3-like [Styela clava]XP_039252808.1 ADP-ribose glycohydrolase ARH3-like [Styela clava]
MTNGQEPTLQSKFQGVSLGALFGDCFGARFEHMKGTPMEEVIVHFDEVVEKVNTSEAQTENSVEKGFMGYTDDTCMTFDLGEALVDKKGYNAKYVLKKFTQTFLAAPLERNYGDSVRKIFYKLKTVGFRGDPYELASKQFDGSGSYGNGSAMRVSPVPLFHHNCIPEMVTLASNQSKLTHSNPKGINGAIFQTLSIEKAMTTEKITDMGKYCRELFEQLKETTPAQEDLGVYEEKIENIVNLLNADHEVTLEEINDKIGTGVAAYQSVPAALFCFLQTLDESKISKLSKFNGMVRTAIYATAMCHDSDTVASMSCAMAGAYYGVESVPSEWVWACEGSDRALKIANALFEINKSDGNKSKDKQCKLM